MNSQEIYALARSLAFTNATEFTDAKLLPFLNTVYHDMENAISTSINQDFFWDYFTVNLVAGQTEYPFQERTALIPGFKKVVEADMMTISTATQYTKMTVTRQTSLARALSYYQLNQTTASPFGVIADNSIFVYPTPTEDIPNGLILYVTLNLVNLTSSSTESEIKIPVQYHEVIALGIVPYIFASRQLNNDRAIADNVYQQRKRDMLYGLSDRYIAPKVSQLPNLQYLNYGNTWAGGPLNQ